MCYCCVPPCVAVQTVWHCAVALITVVFLSVLLLLVSITQTYPVQDDYRYKLYNAVQCHELEDTKWRHQSRPALFDNNGYTGDVRNLGGEGWCNGRFCLWERDACMSCLQSPTIISSISTHPNTVTVNEKKKNHSDCLQFYQTYLKNKTEAKPRVLTLNLDKLLSAEPYHLEPYAQRLCLFEQSKLRIVK